jgi:hypothetical protein
MPGLSLKKVALFVGALVERANERTNAEFLICQKDCPHAEPILRRLLATLLTGRQRNSHQINLYAGGKIPFFYITPQQYLEKRNSVYGTHNCGGQSERIRYEFLPPQTFRLRTGATWLTVAQRGICSSKITFPVSWWGIQT